MEFSRPEYWTGLSFPSPGDLPNPGIKSRSPALQADSIPTELQGSLSKISKWSDPGPLQIIVSQLSFGQCVIFHVPFKSKDCFLHYLILLYASPTDLQSDVKCVLSGVESTSWRPQYGAQIHCFLGRSIVMCFWNLAFISYWYIVDLQYYVNFRCTVKGFTYKYTYIHSFSDYFQKYRIRITVLYSKFLLVYVNCKLLFYPSTPPFPIGNLSLLQSVWICICFVNKFICIIILD